MKRFSLFMLLASVLMLSSSAFSRPSFSDKKDEWKEKASEAKDKWKEKASEAKDKWKEKAQDAKDKWHDKDGWSSGSSTDSSFDDDDDWDYVEYYKCRYVGPGKWYKRSYFSVTSKSKTKALRQSKKRCENRQGEPFTVEVCELISCTKFGKYE